jgi:hypothetical protein
MEMDNAQQDASDESSFVDDDDDVMVHHTEQEDLNSMEECAKYWRARELHDKEQETNVKLINVLKNDLEQLQQLKNINAFFKAKVKVFEDSLQAAAAADQDNI